MTDEVMKHIHRIEKKYKRIEGAPEHDDDLQWCRQWWDKHKEQSFDYEIISESLLDDMQEKLDEGNLVKSVAAYFQLHIKTVRYLIDNGMLKYDPDNQKKDISQDDINKIQALLDIGMELIQIQKEMGIPEYQLQKLIDNKQVSKTKWKKNRKKWSAQKRRNKKLKFEWEK